MPTRIHFEDDHAITVDEDFAAVESALQTSPPAHPSIVKLTRKGESVLINAALVRLVTKPGSARMHAF